jgi:hypothetical protein
MVVMMRQPWPGRQGYVADMVIVDVKTHHLSAALHSPLVTALRRTSTVETLVVEIIDEDGIRGSGVSISLP